MKLARTLIVPFAAFTLALSLPPAVAVADDGWVQDADEKGVVVTTKTEAGRSLPIFRGVSTIDAGLFEILAVLDDIGRFTEWMADCKAARVVKQVSEMERYEYNHIGAPWPVADRDTVIRSWVDGSVAKRDVWARFQSVSMPEAPPVKGIVRMPRLAGYYHLEVIDAGHTKVTYQVDADPGGLLPDWLVKLTSRKLPIETLVGLRKQVAKTRGKYEAFLKKYDPSKGGTIPPSFGK
ncbi:MAG: START domain-containing protein [Minicystis sp.]